MDIKISLNDLVEFIKTGTLTNTKSKENLINELIASGCITNSGIEYIDGDGSSVTVLNSSTLKNKGFDFIGFISVNDANLEDFCKKLIISYVEDLDCYKDNYGHYTSDPINSELQYFDGPTDLAFDRIFEGGGFEVIQQQYAQFLQDTYNIDINNLTKD